jgi:hypothetical protein
MSTSNYTNNPWRTASAVAVFLLVLGIVPALGSRCYAQSQAQPDAQTKLAKVPAAAEASEVPAPVAKELQAMKAQIGQLESQLNYLAALVTQPTTAVVRPALPAPTEATLTGRVSCGHCEGIQPMHKGYTQFSWALYSVGQGDEIVLVAADKTYKLRGNEDKLLKFMGDKARVTGRLQGTTLEVGTIGRASKNE